MSARKRLRHKVDCGQLSQALRVEAGDWLMANRRGAWRGSRYWWREHAIYHFSSKQDADNFSVYLRLAKTRDYSPA